MNTIQVYDPPMCCSTGVCGPEIDPELVSFASLLNRIAELGKKVERFNLSQNPMAFVQNGQVRGLLEKQGVEILPLILVDGVIQFQGRYPSVEERGQLLSVATSNEMGLKQ